MSAPEIVIYGASGHASAVRAALEAHGLARVVAFIDDFRGEDGLAIAGRPVVSFERWHAAFRAHPCLIAIAGADNKRRLARRVTEAGGAFCRLYEDGRGDLVEVTVGAGSLVVPPAYVGTNTQIADHVIVMPMSSVGHDVTIHAFTTICPSSTIGGHVTIEEGVFVGAGSTIINGQADRRLVIGAGATVAAGAVVMKAVPAGATVMGNPARLLRELAAARAASGGTSA